MTPSRVSHGELPGRSTGNGVAHRQSGGLTGASDPMGGLEGRTMVLETVRSDGLAHLSYVLGDDRKGVCVIIDPRRDVEFYLDCARRADTQIIGIIETHIQSDFVSGARELAVAAGAPIYAPASEEYDFEHEALGEGDTVEVGGLTLRVLETPGHSPEHISLLVEGGQGLDAPWAVFTGDTLLP